MIMTIRLPVRKRVIWLVESDLDLRAYIAHVKLLLLFALLLVLFLQYLNWRLLVLILT